MKTHVRLSTIFCLLMFFFIFLYTPKILFARPFAYEKPLAEEGLWWPSRIINPPEFEAFFRILDEKTKGVYMIPQRPGAYDSRVVAVEPEAESIFSEKGDLTGLSIAVSVTTRTEGYIHRLFKYHDVWVGSLDEIFHDLSFLKRSEEENRKLAFGDDDAPYWARVGAAVSSIKQKTTEDALEAIFKFIAAVAMRSSVIETPHLALNQFAMCVDKIFGPAFEPFIGVGQEITPEKLMLWFDYKPRKSLFLLKVNRVTQVFGFILFGKERLVAKVLFTEACSSKGARSLAEKAFRALIAVRDEK